MSSAMSKTVICVGIEFPIHEYELLQRVARLYHQTPEEFMKEQILLKARFSIAKLVP